MRYNDMAAEFFATELWPNSGQDDAEHESKDEFEYAVGNGYERGDTNNQCIAAEKLGDDTNDLIKTYRQGELPFFAAPNIFHALFPIGMRSIKYDIRDAATNEEIEENAWKIIHFTYACRKDATNGTEEDIDDEQQSGAECNTATAWAFARKHNDGWCGRNNDEGHELERRN